MTAFSIAGFMKHWWNVAGKNQSAGYLIQCLLVRYKPPCFAFGFNPRICGEIPTTNSLSCGMTLRFPGY